MYTHYDYLRARRSAEDREKRVSAEWESKLEMIKSHPETVVLDRKDFPDAYEFVEDAFPSCREVISKTTIYKNPNTYFCTKKLGLPKGVGGLFMVKINSILICHNESFSDDVVIVHEMLHYVSQLLGSRSANRGYEEDFAYCNSLPYLKARGLDRDWILDKYLGPFYRGCEIEKMRQAGEKPDEEKAAALARSHCEKLYEHGLGGVIPEDHVDDDDRFGMI